MSIFHFQYLGQEGWEPIGAGLGEGDEAVPMALEELREMVGGDLPTGSYRVIGARFSDPRWESFELDADGHQIDEVDAEESIAR